MSTYQSPLDLVRERPPERPVALVRPDAVRIAARWFRHMFKGETLYALKANPSPWVIRALAEEGVAGFDVASLHEIELAREHAPGARLA
ncbi:MAG TPA: type III PLP-dependent enzyme, partial [Caulobacteraceae bacterium]|nr:type III PLP-dependent enzyme [Caulobacteraceae bacterium]